MKMISAHRVAGDVFLCQQSAQRLVCRPHFAEPLVTARVEAGLEA